MKFLKSLFLSFLLFMSLGIVIIYADAYTDSAHGNRTYGVKRVSMSRYAVTNCGHCHSTTAFEDSKHTGNICLGCHTDTGSCQNGGIINRSYSFRAGGWTADSIDSIKEAFSFTSVSYPSGSSHGLEDIVRFAAGKWPSRYDESSNPCCACHNPHAVQGDPFNKPNSVKKSNKRGWPLTLTSNRRSKVAVDILYGDNTSLHNERMNNYTYQSPCRYNKIDLNQYEPDGSITTDGANLTNFVTFCTECHTKTDDITSTNQNILVDNIGTGSKLVRIDWDIALHGKANGDKNNEKAPYEAANYILSCTDCHEPHGSPNLYLIRQAINGTSGVALTKNTRAAWNSLCVRCHNSKSAAPYCTGDDDGSKVCSGCHYHGLNF